MMTGPADSRMTDLEDRRAAVRAQLSALSEHELRVFVARLARRDVAAVELPLAEFLAGRAANLEETCPGGAGDPGIIVTGASGSTAPGTAELIAGVDAPATARGFAGLRDRDARDEPDPAGEVARIAALIESYRARRADEGG
jgi:hypothetical protein